MALVTCPFCGCDPYEYVDNGVGMEPVAITCCSLGREYFDPGDEETVTIGRGTFDSIADLLRAMRRAGMDPAIELD